MRSWLPSDPVARRNVLAVAGILGTLLVVALVAGPQGPTGADTEDLRPSSYLSTPGGVRALHLVLDDLGVPVGRWLEPWQADADPAVLVVLAPTQPPDAARVEALRSWVEAGNTVILAPAPGDTILTRGLGLPAAFERPAEPDSVVDPEGAEPPAPPASPVPMATPRPTLPLGRGTVVVWADPGPLTNQALRLDPAPAVAFVEDVRAWAGPETPVLFDEFVHGYEGGGSPAQALARFLTGNGWGRWLTQGLVGALLLVVALGARFGAPLPPRTARFRTPLEHAEALAAVYRKAGARRTARRYLLAGLSRRVGVRLRGDDDLLVLPPRLSELPSAQRLTEAWAASHASDEAFLHLTRQIDALEAERRAQ